MATIVFYEKPGCATNARQRQVLEAAGHQVISRSLLAEPWTGERLLRFFEGLAVADWFNRASPRVKSGEIDPLGLTAEDALALLVADRLLIRRPLLEIGTLRMAGFDPQRLQANTGLQPPDAARGLQDCPRLPEPHRPRF
ncbi:MAG: hypothetical protein WDO56_24825 [Gammaproteobacteria bacterium]